MAIDVGLKPAALSRIMPGGLPKQRASELLGLLSLAAGLVLCSLLLLRREAELTRTRAAFVASVSHELRTPLAQIRMFAETLLLERVRTDGDRRRSLEIIEKEALRLTQLVENVLQIARSERGAIHVNPAETALAPVVREAVETFLVLAEASRIEFRLELQEHLIVPVDTAAFRQILLNLLDNAAKYGPPGQRVTVGLALFGSTARVWVDDEGSGINARERERVFETFYRSPRDERSHITGSGIGLAVVRELAVLHGGSAHIEDAPRGGTRVVIEFPGAYVAAGQPTHDWAVA
jgi:signal transduction histidine kinase